jgi:hypothetical protein
MRRWILLLVFVEATISCGSAAIEPGGQGGAGGGRDGSAGGAGGAACATTCPSGATCESGACTVRYGFFSAFSGAVTANTGYLFGETISVPTAITATKLGAILTNAASAKATLALYSDVSGSPSALVVQTASTSIENGANEVAVTSTHLAAATYWLMAEYSAAVEIEVSSCDNCQVVATSSASYGPFPSKLTATNGTGSNLAYYIVGTE